MSKKTVGAVDLLPEWAKEFLKIELEVKAKRKR